VKYSNEIKVGATIVIATIVFILGLRFFQDLPLFRGTYNLVAEFDQASGLISGNGVRISGVVVGSVDDVSLDPASGRVRVRFHVDRDIPVTEGSWADIQGFDALGVVRMDIHLGPGARLPEGGLLEGRPSNDVLGTLSDKAPGLVDELDNVLGNLNRVLGETGALITEPESDVRRTLVSVQSSAETLDQMLDSERDRIGRILANVESFSGGLDSLTSENADSVSALVSDLRGTLRRLDRNMQSLESVSASLSEVLRKVNEGEGTLGLMVNDPGLYLRLDSVLSNTNALLTEFRAHPEKFLKEMRLVEIF